VGEAESLDCSEATPVAVSNGSLSLAHSGSDRPAQLLRKTGSSSPTRAPPMGLGAVAPRFKFLRQANMTGDTLGGCRLASFGNLSVPQTGLPSEAGKGPKADDRDRPVLGNSVVA
jgi:hypothetical protein